MKNKLFINSIEEIVEFLFIEWCLVAQKRGLSPRDALREKGMIMAYLIPDDWKALDYRTWSKYMVPEIVENISRSISNNYSLNLEKIEEEVE